MKKWYFAFFLFLIILVSFMACNKTKDVTNPADTTAPEISNITATSISSSQATINWTTNEPATSQVLYGLTSSYGSQTQEDSSLVSSHSMTLTNLQSGVTGVTYHYQVKSRDAAGNTRTSADNLFKTVAVAPVISNVTVKDITDRDATIEWKTDQPATSKVYYKILASTGGWKYATEEDTNLNTAHRVRLGGYRPLDNFTQYAYYVYSKNSIGLSSTKGEDQSLTFITLY